MINWFLWYLVICLLGWLAFPIAYRLLPGLKDRGYASSRTRDMSLERHKLVNFDVSQRRAEAVAAELIRQGAQPQSVFVEARSDTLPVYSEAMPRAERNNRRAEIFLEN